MKSAAPVILLVFLTDLCDTVSQLVLKHSINLIDLQANNPRKVFGLLWRLARTPRVWLGFSFSNVSLAIWLFVLTKAELNFAYCLDSMHYILIAFVSMFFLKERVGLIRWLGIASVALGIALVAGG